EDTYYVFEWPEAVTAGRLLDLDEIDAFIIDITDRIPITSLDDGPIKVLDDIVYSAAFKKRHAEWVAEELQYAEQEAIKRYTGAQHLEINQYLRAGKLPNSPYAETVKDMCQQIETAFQKAPELDRDILLFRGASRHALGIEDFSEESLGRWVGTVIED